MEAFRGTTAVLHSRWQAPAQQAGYDRWVAHANNASFTRAGGSRRIGARLRALFAQSGQRWHPFYDAVKNWRHYRSRARRPTARPAARPVSPPWGEAPLSRDPHPPPPPSGLGPARSLFCGPSRPRKIRHGVRLRGGRYQDGVFSPCGDQGHAAGAGRPVRVQAELGFLVSAQGRIETEIAEQLVLLPPRRAEETRRTRA